LLLISYSGDVHTSLGKGTYAGVELLAGGMVCYPDIPSIAY
jgi:hypothetical protein